MIEIKIIKVMLKIPGGYLEYIVFDIISIERYKIILEISWIRHYNPNID
jgi:hypothetical protein